MNANFYRIERESYIDEIMENNPFKLIVLIFSVDANNKESINTNIIKKNIKKNFSNDKETIFLYINLQNYLLKENKYSRYITKDSIPYISFYFKANHLARIISAEYNIFAETYHKLKNDLKDHFILANKQLSHDTIETNENIENIETNENINNIDNLNNVEKNITDEDTLNLKDQIKQQRKLEEIEKLKQQYLINELTKLKRAKEIQEKIENTANN